MNRQKLIDLAARLRGETLSETPQSSSSDIGTYQRELGYRAGWNDRTRSIATELQVIAEALS